MRLTSAIWVAAFVRTEMAHGTFAAITRRGSPEAGAIFVVHAHSEGLCTLYAPAPQSEFGVGEGGGRKFEIVLERVADGEARAYLDKQIRFDPDCWIVETERGGDEPPPLLYQAGGSGDRI